VNFTLIFIFVPSLSFAIHFGFSFLSNLLVVVYLKLVGHPHSEYTGQVKRKRGKKKDFIQRRTGNLLHVGPITNVNWMVVLYFMNICCKIVLYAIILI
jgi:hypothetical protein